MNDKQACLKCNDRTYLTPCKACDETGFIIRYEMPIEIRMSNHLSVEERVKLSEVKHPCEVCGTCQ